MPRVISLLVLLAIILMVGAVFFQVMAEFMVPLFLACVLLVVFQPLHAWILQRLPRHPRLSALFTTVLILLAVLVPLTWLGWNAYLESRHAIEWLQDPQGGQAIFAQGYDWVDLTMQKVFREAEDTLNDRPPDAEPDAEPPEVKLPKPQPPDAEPSRRPIKPPTTETLLAKSTEYLGPFLLAGVQTILGVIIGLVIMVISLYYFLVDGPAMIGTLMQLSPLDDKHELELLARFAQISRSVVVATLLSAVAQGVVAGIGYWVVLPAEAPVFLLTALTMVMAIVPFVGAAGVWVPVCLGLLLWGGGDGQPAGSNWPVVLGFAVYCGVVVSGLDNVIKPYVLHGQAHLHPLLALLSILGGVKVFGPIGILVGPMLVSFLQALLSIFRREVEQWENPNKQLQSKLSPAAEALAETIEAAANVVEEKPAESKAPKRGRVKARRL